MRRLFKFKYPKIALLLITIILSYFLFSYPLVQELIHNLDSFRYLSVFLFGLLFSFGFTTPFAIAFFLSLDQGNIFLIALIAGFGALIADLLIFKWIKISFMKEFRNLQRTIIITKITNKTKSIPHKLKIYLLYACAGIIIASPLPDELGVTMMAGLTHINIKKLGIISFIMNFLGILIILLINRFFII